MFHIFKLICIFIDSFILQALIDLLQLSKFPKFRELVWKISIHFHCSQRRKSSHIHALCVHVNFLRLTSRNTCISIGIMVYCICLARGIFKAKVICLGVTTENRYFPRLFMFVMW